MMKTTRNWTLSLALVGLLAGCGSEEAPRPKTTPVGGNAADAAAPAAKAGSAPLAGNRPPVIRRIGLRPSRPTPGSIVAADVDAFDPDGDEIALSYAWTIDGSRVGEDRRTLLLDDVSKDSVIQVTVIARDDDARSDAETVTARVGNRPPTMLGVVIEPLAEVRADHDIAARPRARDPDGDALEFRYRWSVNGETVEDDDEVLPASHYQRGDQIELTVVAFDGEDVSDPLHSAPFPVVNSPPRITSIPGGFDPEGTFRYAVLAEDADGDRGFHYRLETAPEGMAIDMVSGELTWVPTPDQAGSHPVVIEVGDRKGGVATQSFDIRVEFEQEPAPASPAP
jgi:hypothetical protein